jgi:hypothetical protein
MSKTLKTLVAAAALAATTVASATPIVGLDNLTFGQVVITLGNVDWNNDPLNLNPPPNGATTTVGGFVSQNTRTGSFLGVPIGSAGTIRDMADPTILPGETGNHFLMGAPTFVHNFLTFAAKPNWIFDATFLVPGTTVIGIPTPFLLGQSGQNVSATITVNGQACDDLNTNGVCDPTDDITKWTGIFSAQFTNTTVAGLAAKLVGPDGIPFTADDGALDNNTWSGTIEATRLPEPATVGLVGLALAGLGFAGRRRQAK